MLWTIHTLKTIHCPFLRAQLQTQAVEVRIAAVQRGHHLPQRGSLRSAADGGQVGE